MKRAIRIGVVVLIVALLAAGGFWLYRSRTSAQTSSTANSFTQIVDVKLGSLRSNISVVGELDAEQRADLSFTKMSGATKLLTLAVKAGNTVKAGQVLATIDPAPYQQALDQAKSDLKSAEKKLADLKTPVTDLQRAQADLKVAKAEYQLAEAQDALDELLHPDMAALQSAVADAQTALATARLDLAELQADKTTADQLVKLYDTEADAAEDFARLANETHVDTYYQDRLQLANNKMMNAREARVTAEVQAQINILKAQMQITKAQADLADAQEALAEAQAGGDKLALAKAQLAVKEAEVTLASARDARAELDEGTDATTLAAAQADVDKKRLALADAEAALTGARLIAPFDGTILKTNVQTGDLIAASTTVLTLANLKVLQVVAAVDETTIRRVAVGQSAQISFDALPGQTFRGKVLEVPLQGALQGNVMVYDVPLALTGAENLPLLVGMTANVQIAVGQVENALLVPAMAIQKVSGRTQVLVPDASAPTAAPVAVPVEVGLSDGVNTQIVKGLNAGDKVVVQMTASQSTNFFGPGGGMMTGGGPPPEVRPAGR